MEEFKSVRKREERMSCSDLLRFIAWEREGKGMSEEEKVRAQGGKERRTIDSVRHSA